MCALGFKDADNSKTNDYTKIYKVRNSYIVVVLFMPEIVKITSKGQLTIPVKYRRQLGLDKDSYILVDDVGDFLILEKIKKLDQITKILSSKAKEEGLTKKDVLKTLREIQEEKWKA